LVSDNEGGTWTVRVFENRVLRRIFGPERNEVIGGWAKLHNEKLHNLYSSPSIIRMNKSIRMRWAGHVACMGDKLIAYRVLVGKPEGNRSLERRSFRWEDNIKMNLDGMIFTGLILLRTGPSVLC
jgi:hypothetical protein